MYVYCIKHKKKHKRKPEKCTQKLPKCGGSGDGGGG